VSQTRKDWSRRRVSNPRHSAWKAEKSERNSVVLRGASVACPVIVSSFGALAPDSAEAAVGRLRPGRSDPSGADADPGKTAQARSCAHHVNIRVITAGSPVA
jgi:hypothetical protein